jgi:hypothetical protein
MDRKGPWLITVGLGLGAAIVIIQAAGRGASPWLFVAVLAWCLAIAGYGAWLNRQESQPVARTREDVVMEHTNEPGRWEPVGASGRFFSTSLPMSDEAQALNGGRPKTLIYGEFDTSLEAESWRAFVYDPLRVLSAEGILEQLGDVRRHIEIEIVKLTGEELDNTERRTALRARGDTSAEMYRAADVSDDARESWRVTTTVANHEQPLNPRIVTMSILV